MIIDHIELNWLCEHMKKVRSSHSCNELNKMQFIRVSIVKPGWLTHVTCTCFKETALLFNVHLSCFVDFILCPTDKYMFKVNNISSKLKINTTWHDPDVSIVDFDHSQYINIVFLLLTWNKYLSVGLKDKS